MGLFAIYGGSRIHSVQHRSRRLRRLAWKPLSTLGRFRDFGRERSSLPAIIFGLSQAPAESAPRTYGILWNCRAIPALIAAILIAIGHSTAQVSTSVVLLISANPSILGQSSTLTATVSPSTAVGKVTFYDGTTVLGTRTIAGGQAALTTSVPAYRSALAESLLRRGLE